MFQKKSDDFMEETAFDKLEVQKWKSGMRFPNREYVQVSPRLASPILGKEEVCHKGFSYFYVDVLHSYCDD